MLDCSLVGTSDIRSRNGVSTEASQRDQCSLYLFYWDRPLRLMLAQHSQIGRLGGSPLSMSELAGGEKYSNLGTHTPKSG